MVRGTPIPLQVRESGWHLYSLYIRLRVADQGRPQHGVECRIDAAEGFYWNEDDRLDREFRCDIYAGQIHTESRIRRAAMRRLDAVHLSSFPEGSHSFSRFYTTFRRSL